MLTFHTDPFLPIPVFLSGDQRRCILWIGAQCDGFFSLNYMPQLIQEAATIGWSVAQLLSSSSFLGHGGRSHIQVAEDLDLLVGLLLNETQMREVTLFATSTGVQVALEFLDNGRNAEAVTRVVLQGFVCDPQDSFFNAKGVHRRLARAKELCDAGQRESVEGMGAYYDIPITPGRCVKGGAITVQEAFWVPASTGDVEGLAKVMRSVRVPMLVLLAAGPKYSVTVEQRKKFEAQLKSAASTTELTIAFMDESCDEARRMLKSSQVQHTVAVVEFLKDQDNKRKVRDEKEKQALLEEARRNRSVLAKSNLKLP